MLCGKVLAVCSEISAKQINALWWQHVELAKDKPACV